MPPNTPNPYDFITSSQQKPARSFRPANKKQLIILVILVSAVIIILSIVANIFLGKAAKAQNQKLIGLAQTQTEIVRVAEIGAGKSASPETKSLAITTQLSVESAKQDVLGALQKRKVKVKEKTLNVGKNAKTDSQLQEAAVNNRFDQTFTQLIQTKLASYQKQAKSVYGTSSPSEQKTFLRSINGVSLLLPKTTDQE